MSDWLRTYPRRYKSALVHNFASHSKEIELLPLHFVALHVQHVDIVQAESSILHAWQDIRVNRSGRAEGLELVLRVARKPAERVAD
jgi:hypothetical protein